MSPTGCCFASTTPSDDVFRRLVLTRIIEPTSKVDAARVLTIDDAPRYTGVRSINRSHCHDGRSNQALVAERLGSVTFGQPL